MRSQGLLYVLLSRCRRNIPQARALIFKIPYLNRQENITTSIDHCMIYVPQCIFNDKSINEPVKQIKTYYSIFDKKYTSFPLRTFLGVRILVAFNWIVMSVLNAFWKRVHILSCDSFLCSNNATTYRIGTAYCILKVMLHVYSTLY